MRPSNYNYHGHIPPHQQLQLSQETTNYYYTSNRSRIVHSTWYVVGTLNSECIRYSFFFFFFFFCGHCSGFGMAVSLWLGQHISILPAFPSCKYFEGYAPSRVQVIRRKSRDGKSQCTDETQLLMGGQQHPGAVFIRASYRSCKSTSYSV